MIRPTRRRARAPWRVFAAVVIAAGVALGLGRGHPALAAGGSFTQYTYSGPAGSLPYYVYTPAGYTPAARVPVVVMLHGCTQNPVSFAAATGMNDLADSNQFIVVYPQQTVDGPYFCWHWYHTTDQSRGSGEPAIIAGIAQTVMADTRHWNIDSHRVYVAGFSSGAAMSVIMGATYPDLFAAIGEESGLEYGAANDAASANNALFYGGPSPQQQGLAAYNAMGAQARVLPVIVFHGTNDSIVYPINGDQVVQQWMETDRLALGNRYNAAFEAPSDTQLGTVPGLGGHAFSIRKWNDSTGREIQEYWSVVGMGHAWSGGPSGASFTDPNGPSASASMYAFFMAHPN